MIPDGVLSTTPVTTGSIPPRSSTKQDLVDFDYGPVDITDTSQGLLVKTWKGTVNGIGQVIYSAPGVSDYIVTTIANAKELSITFDQNGRPSFAYWDGINSFLYWYNTVDAQFETLELPAGSYNPRVILDDKREFNLANSDVLLVYIRQTTLYIRYQRERFATEHAIAELGGFARLVNIGMNSKNRIEFIIQKSALVTP